VKPKAEGLILKLLRSGKVLLIPQSSRIHYTLHPGQASGVIDFHKTDESIADSLIRYERLFAISKDELVRNLAKIGEAPFLDLLKLFRPIRLGWIARNRLGIVAFPTDSELDGVSEIRISADSCSSEKLLRNWFRVPEFIEDIFEMPNTAFILSKFRNQAQFPYGLLFKFRTPDGGWLLRWIRLRDLRRWTRRMEGLYSSVFRNFCVSQNF
jgi:hypothetical protein